MTDSNTPPPSISSKSDWISADRRLRPRDESPEGSPLHNPLEAMAGLDSSSGSNPGKLEDVSSNITFRRHIGRQMMDSDSGDQASGGGAKLKDRLCSDPTAVADGGIMAPSRGIVGFTGTHFPQSAPYHESNFSITQSACHRGPFMDLFRQPAWHRNGMP